MATIQKTATEIRNGDIVIQGGCRFRVSGARVVTNDWCLIPAHSGELIARYTLTNEPNDEFPRKAPTGYTNWTSGGNEKHMVTVEVQ